LEYLTINASLFTPIILISFASSVGIPFVLYKCI
jgi:hypothetical protein